MAEQRSADGDAGRTRRRVLAALGSAGVAGVAGCTNGRGTTNGGGGVTDTGGGGVQGATGGEGTTTDSSQSISGPITIFHAGSLAPPWSGVEKQFEQDAGIQVQREAKGSVGSTKKITEQGRKADVLGVSDFRLIRDMMMGEFADWYGIFVTNAMTVAYTEDSKYANEFSTGNWWEVLSRSDVTVAHSDPAVDPNGYRSLMAMELGAIPLDGKKLYDRATARKMKEQANITAGTETDLIGQLESGALDYAWEYKSASAAHESLQTVDLQPHVNLAKATNKYAKHYAKAEVKAGGNTYTGAPIAYGITVPSVAEHPTAGAKWVEYVTTGAGVSIMQKNGFATVSPMVVPAKARSAVPESVMDGATAQERLGPLQL